MKRTYLFLTVTIISSLFFNLSSAVGSDITPRVTFRVDKSYRLSGQSAQLSWQVENASNVRLLQNETVLSESVRGTLKVRPKVTTDYALEVTPKNSNVSATSVVRVTVFTHSTGLKWRECTDSNRRCEVKYSGEYDLLIGETKEEPEFLSVARVPDSSKIVNCAQGPLSGSNPNPELKCFYRKRNNLLSLGSISESPASTRDGRPILQLGSSILAHYVLEDPFVDAMKINSVPENLRDGNAFSVRNQRIVPQFMNQSDASRNIAEIRFGAQKNASFYAGTWILDWEGDGELRFTGRGSELQEVKDPAANRVSLVAGSNDTNITGIKVLQVGTAGISNIRVFKEDQEEQLESGDILNPHYLNLLKKHKVFRPMSWSSVNDSRVIKTNQLAKFDDIFWAHPGDLAEVNKNRVGIPTESLVVISRLTNTALWLNAPPKLGAPEDLVSEDFLNREWPRSEDLVSEDFLNPEWPRSADKWNYISNFAAQVFASDEYQRYARYLVDILDRYNYPETWDLYLELGNEIWNWGGGFNHTTSYFNGLGKALRINGKTVPNYRGAYGYLSAKLHTAVKTELARRGRNQKFTLVLAAHTADSRSTDMAIKGYKLYMSEHRLDTNSYLPELGIATTGYFKGGFTAMTNDLLFGRTGNYISKDIWRANWINQIQTNQNVLSQNIENYLLNERAIQNNLSWVMARTAEHAQIAQDQGQGVIKYIGQYEGLSHDKLDKNLAERDPQVVPFFEAWMQSAYHMRVVKESIERFRRVYPDAMFSNFVFYGDRAGRHAPWIDAYPWENAPLLQNNALGPYLRQSD